MKILITGSNGLLGQKLVYRLVEDTSVELIATARGENRLRLQEGYTYVSMDISNDENVQAVIKAIKPDCIIHTAAMTNVDACESEQAACRKLNVDAVSYLVKAIENHSPQTHFVHLSTDFIFDGEDGPYDELATPNPVSFYGQSKLDAERVVQSSSISWAIARTIIVYGITDNMSRSNIVLWTKQNLEQHKPINVVTDQFRSPTLAEDLAEGCILIAKQKATGVYNLSGPVTYSILELVTIVADYFHLDKSYIQPVTSQSLNQPAKRPPRTGFIIDKAVRELGYKPHTFVEGIAIVMQQFDLYQQEK
jgi:dTDP-4-dehydrorhamnose reductase